MTLTYKRYKRAIVTGLPLIFFATLLLPFQYSCQRPDIKMQVQKMDTLENILGRVGDLLIIDEIAVEKRLDTIEMKLDTLLNALPDSGDMELKNAIVKYAGIAAVYKEFLQEYPVLDFDAEKHAKIVTDLRKQVEAGEIPDKEFNKTYNLEKDILRTIEMKTRELTYRIYSVEKDYIRNSVKINEVYRRLVY